MNIFRKDFWFRNIEEATAEPKMDVIYRESNHGLIDLDEKANRADKVDYQGIGRTKYASGQPPTTNYTSPLNAFNNYPVVYACVTAKSDAISSLGIKVYKVKGGEEVEDTKHDFHEIFRRPNPFQGSQEFIEQISQNIDLFGNCFISIEKGSPLELYVLNTQYVAIIPDANKKIKEYKYVINGQEIKYKPEEIIHIKVSDPSDPYYGKAPLSTATKVLALEDSRISYATNFLKNHAVPMGVLTTENTVSETILNKLRSEWTRLHQGATKAGTVAILQGGLKFESIASPLKDLDFKSLKELSNSDILSIFRIPPVVIGDMNNVSSDEGKSALTAWWRGSLIPHLKRIESALNKGLRDVLFGSGKSYFRFNLTDVAALQDDKEALQKYLTGLVSSSIMTGNEARAVVGLPKSTAQYMDEPLVSNSWFGNQNMPLAEASNQGAGSNTEKPTAKPKKDIDYVLYDATSKINELTKYLKFMD